MAKDINTALLELILPEGILEHFEIINSSFAGDYAA